MFYFSTGCRLPEVMAHTSLIGPSNASLCSHAEKSSINLLTCKIILQLMIAFFFQITDRIFSLKKLKIETQIHLCFNQIHIWGYTFIFFR